MGSEKEIRKLVQSTEQGIPPRFTHRNGSQFFNNASTMASQLLETS